MRKRCCGEFAYYDGAGIQAYLQRMARRGWQLVKAGGWWWTFERCAPREGAIAVVYGQEGEEAEMALAYEQAGWRVIKAGSGRLIVDAIAGVEPPVGEAAEQLGHIHRGMKKSLRGSLVSLTMGLFLLPLLLDNIGQRPVFWLTSGMALLAVASLLFMMVDIPLSLLSYGFWYSRARLAVAAGRAIKPCWGGRWRGAYRTLFLAGAMGWALVLALDNRRMALIGAVLLGILLLIIVVLLRLARRWQLSAGEERLMIFGVTVFLAVLLAAAISPPGGVGLFDRPPVERYAVPGDNFLPPRAIYHDALPLVIEDFQPVTYEHYSYEAKLHRSPLAARYTGRQVSKLYQADAPPDLHYEIVEVRQPALYQWCVAEYLYHRPWSDAVRLDRPDWPVTAVYRYGGSSSIADVYLLCGTGRIIFVNFGWAASETEVERAVRILADFELPEKRGGWTNDEEAAL